jgi:hypothetical protein
MVLSVEFSRLASMVSGVLMMAMGRVCMMAGGFVVARVMVLCCFMMMPSRVLVVLGCLAMMFCRLLRHSSSSQIPKLPQPHASA